MDDFFYEQSTLQAFYLIDEVLIDGNPIDSDDWVVAYKGDICVGARQWDVAQCGNGVCDVPVMGDDGSIGTDGYMIVDEIPTFSTLIGIIIIVSSGIYIFIREKVQDQSIATEKPMR